MKHSCSSVQLLSRVQLFVTPWIAAARPPCPSPTPEVHPNPCPLSGWCHPTNSSSVVPILFLPSIFPSIRVFSNESVLCMRWPKYWSFRFSISPSNEHPGLISFRMDWLDLLAVQGTLRSLQHHSSKASILLQYLTHSKCSPRVSFLPLLKFLKDHLQFQLTSNFKD